MPSLPDETCLDRNLGLGRRAEAGPSDAPCRPSYVDVSRRDDYGVWAVLNPGPNSERLSLATEGEASLDLVFSRRRSAS